ncbi:hypothetical protein [Dyella sp. ASV21]|uniref:hypothetical protein n=1 Tax=Dyella sp. ASV21 TaxID=2795114 RepID=UPI0018EBCC72|nr:hypothetical protein [Dyella sp. ASV21]
MSAPVRSISETATAFDRRVCMHAARIGQGSERVERDARLVYVEGVHAGLSIAVAALQRRERLIDYLRRWEGQLRSLQERESGG